MTPPKTKETTSARKSDVPPIHVDNDYADGLRLDQIEVWDQNPRKVFDEAELAELATSILDHGVQQPIVVRYLGGILAHQARYQIIMGERRFRASVMVGMKTIRAIVRVGLSDVDALTLAIIENCQRSDLSPLEKARSFRSLIDAGKTHQEVGALLSIPSSTVSNCVRLLDLPEDVQGLVSSGKLQASHAKALLRFREFPQVLSKIAALVVKEGVPSKTLEKGVPFARELRDAKLIEDLDYSTAFDKSVCESCPVGAYFAGAERWEGGYCLRPDEYRRKQAEAKEAVAALARESMLKVRQQSEQVHAKLEKISVQREQSAPGPDFDAKVEKAEQLLPRLSNLAYSDWASLSDPRTPRCSQACGCCVLVLGNDERPRCVCLDPGRLNVLKAKETKRKREEVRAAFKPVREQVCALEAQGFELPPMEAEDVYHRMVAMMVVSTIQKIDVDSRRRAIRKWNRVDDPELVKILQSGSYDIRDSEAWPIFARLPAHVLLQIAVEMHVLYEIDRKIEFTGLKTAGIDFLLDRKEEEAPAPAVDMIVVDPPFRSAREEEEEYDSFDPWPDGAECAQFECPISKILLGYPYTTEEKQDGTRMLRLESGILVVQCDDDESVYCFNCAKEHEQVVSESTGAAA